MSKRGWGWLWTGGLSVSLIASSGPSAPVTANVASGVSGGSVSWSAAVAGAFGGGKTGGGRSLPRSVDLHLTALPRQEPPPRAVVWPEPTRVKELTARRTATTRVFQLSDGRTQAEISQVPVSYRDAGGVWRPIDTTVKPAAAPGFAAGNTTNVFGSWFGTRSAVSCGSPSMAGGLRWGWPGRRSRCRRGWPGRP